MVDYSRKSSIEEIERRFDDDVDRFSDLENGQVATVDAPLAMELISQAAVAASAPVRTVLDIGCGAGNNTLKLLQHVPRFDCDLADLSANMLERAQQRVAAVNGGRIRTFKGDFRRLDLPEDSYDVILAAAVLHHLRDDRDWETAFAKIHRLLRTGGSVWITDLVAHESERIQEIMWRRYGEYLMETGTRLGRGGALYRDTVFAYIKKEDSPRPVTYQLDLLKRTGFRSVDLLHKSSCFAAFGAIK